MLVATLTGSELAHHCAYVWLTRSNICKTRGFRHRLSTYQGYNPCAQKYVIRHMSVTASQNTGNSIVCSRIYSDKDGIKTKQTFTLLREIPWSPVDSSHNAEQVFHVMTSSCSNPFAICNDINVVKAYQHDNRCCNLHEKNVDSSHHISETTNAI